MLEIKKLTDKNKQQYYPITHVDAVIGIDGRTVAEILDEDYASKEYVAEYGGKIDKITVDGTELPIVDKTVDIPSYDDAELRDLIATNSTAIAAETTRATARENTIDQKFGSYIPTSEKGSNNGVATLNNNGRVPEGQLQFPTRGQIPSNIDDTNLDNGIYNVNGKVISSDVLNGEQANGVFIQYPYGSKVQQLIVGRAANASGGEQVETYTRRYLSTPQRWTQWNSGGAVPSSLTYALSKSGNTISLNGSDSSVSSVDVENTTYGLVMRDNQIVLSGSDGSEEAVSYGVLSLDDVYSGDTSSGTSIGKLISQDVVVKSRMASVSYDELVALRNEGKLSPGLQYRITDYSTVVNQRYCSSAGHDFDIIVTADDERTLNENARAISGDTNGYFDSNNLSAWELKYSLDNDSSKYGWASPSGKGVIYFMRDEHGNECPYDFKNVIYEFDVESPSGGTLTLSGYTFTSFSGDGSGWTVVDATLCGTRGQYDGENIPRYNNVVRVFSDAYDACHFLNRICVYGMPRTSCHWGTLQVVFDSGCHDIFIGGCNPFTNNSEEISKIKVGCSSSSIILPRVSYYLNIGNFCYNITQSSQGGTLTDLTIGDYGSSINFGLMSLDKVEIGANCFAIRGSGRWYKLTLGDWSSNLNLKNSSSSSVYKVTIDKFVSGKTIEPPTNTYHETFYQAADKQIITI